LDYLVNRLNEEIAELLAAPAGEALLEAADVAALAMMLAENIDAKGNYGVDL
jgi:hypothetical protein